MDWFHLVQDVTYSGVGFTHSYTLGSEATQEIA